MKYVECPDEWDSITYPDEWGIFLAGGITNCPDWQQEMRYLLEETDLTVVNPRRENFPMGDDAAATFQIEWEFRHMRRVDAILFWLPADTLCPITLYELGAWSMEAVKPIFVGTSPSYTRRLDVVEQTALVRPDIEVVDSLSALADQVIAAEGDIRG